MVTLHGFFRWMYAAGNGIAKAMYLHMLWVGFTVLGLGVFGIFPATAALFHVIHKWLEGETEFSIVKQFAQVYKSQFVKANGCGLILTSMAVFLYFDLAISQNIIQSAILHLFLLILVFLLLLMSLYLFLVFARYELTIFSYFKQSLFIALARPFETIAILLSLVLLYYLVIYVPVLLFFMGASLLAFPVAWFSYRACVEIEEKKKQ